jgi:hypothetical protein
MLALSMCFSLISTKGELIRFVARLISLASSINLSTVFMELLLDLIRVNINSYQFNVSL